MSKLAVRGFRINTILDRLTLDMLRIFETCLCAPNFDRDRFHLTILMTLSRRCYISRLLYQDFLADPHTQWLVYDLPNGKSLRIHEQSIVYLDRVLSRRLKLARRLLAQPGNMHLLLGSFCHFASAEAGWERVVVRRGLERPPTHPATEAFNSLSHTLKQQRDQLGEDDNEDAQRRRAKYGPIWLTLPDQATEVPEKMSIFDVVEATPVPLRPAFSSDPKVQRLVARVLDSLNERYKLLRSTGLDPEHWYDREELAIGRLRDLRLLLRQAEESLRLGIEHDKTEAYRRAFISLQRNAKTYAGYADFDSFATSRIGLEMLRYPALSLDELIASDDGDWSLSESLSDPDAEDSEEIVTRQRTATKWVELLIADRPKWFSPAMRTFFVEVIAGGRPIYLAPNDPGLLGDAAFRQLVAADPELRGLEDGELAEELYRQAEKLIKRGVHRQAVAGI